MKDNDDYNNNSNPWKLGTQEYHQYYDKTTLSMNHINDNVNHNTDTIYHVDDNVILMIMILLIVIMMLMI